MSVVQRGFLYSLSLCCNAWLLWGCTTIAVPVRGQDAVSNLVARCEMEFRQGKTNKLWQPHRMPSDRDLNERRRGMPGGSFMLPGGTRARRLRTLLKQSD